MTSFIVAMLKHFIEKHQLPAQFTETANAYYQPIAERIKRDAESSSGVYFVGVNGCQGSGKSTFTDYVGEYLKSQYGLNVMVISLDDFYLTGEARQALASNVHPLLSTRGVPGTHDTKAIANTFKKLSRCMGSGERDFLIPRFDKSTDEPFAKDYWTQVDKPVDIVLFEGWCWGVPPQSQSQLIAPVNKLEAELDDSAKWRLYVNQQLETEYLPLYNAMHYWVMLKAPSFDCVHQWRLEQEQKLIDKLEQSGEKSSELKVMDSAQIAQFIQHYQRLTEQGLLELPSRVDVLLTLSSARAITNIEFKDELC